MMQVIDRRLHNHIISLISGCAETSATASLVRAGCILATFRLRCACVNNEIATTKDALARAMLVTDYLQLPCPIV